MALWDIFKTPTPRRSERYARMLSGYSPIFSQFGENVYASDVVQNCIDVIATEISKLQPRHIRLSGGLQETPKGSINRLLKFTPNEVMTTRDFLEKIVWLLFLNYNCFILPTYLTTEDGSRYYTGLYPLNPTQVEYLQDALGTLLIRLRFSSGQEFTLYYSDIIHLRKKFSVNEIMGGGQDGQPDNAALLKVLRINDSVLQGLEKGIKTSMSVRGIIKINTVADNETMAAERRRVEDQLATGGSGILPVDLKGEYTPIQVDPKFVDKDTLEFLQSKVLNWFGVSVPILTGRFNDEEYQAFYEKALEPIMISLGQAFSKALFTPRELDFGNEIVFYQKDMMYLSARTKLDLLKTAGEQGLLTDNQKLALLGYPPIESGERRTQSLNYIDVRLVNQYQLSGAKPQKPNTEDEHETGL